MGVSVLAILGGVIASQGLVQGMLYSYPPYISGRARQTFPKTPNVLPDIDKLVAMRYKGEITPQDFMTAAIELGYNQEWAHAIEDASRRMLDAESYARIWRRGIITEEQLNESLSSLHFQDPDIDRLKSATEYFPQPVDLIRFAVREVYNPVIREQFQMDEDISDKYLQEAAKAGLPEEQARNFWAAHWDLPSPQMAFEMFQRQEIDESELANLLKALDIMPFWRDKLTRIAYNPLTRVDVRRMHSVGVLDEAGVEKAYRDVGFSPENAKLMTAFTIQYNARSSTGITRANVMKAYKMGLMSREELAQNLVDFGFAPKVIAFWMDLADYEKTMELLEDHQSTLFNQFRKGLITSDQLKDALIQSGLPDTYLQTAINQVNSEIARKTRMPTKGDVEKWLTIDIISIEQWTEYMRNLGYRDIEIEHYLTELIIEHEEREVKYLGIKTYQKWLKSGIMNIRRFVQIAHEIHISAQDVASLIREVGFSDEFNQEGFAEIARIYEEIEGT